MSCIKMLIAYQEIITFLSEEDGQMETVLCVKRKEKEYQVDQSLCSSYRVPILRSAWLEYHSHYNIKDHVLHDLRKEQLTLYKPSYNKTFDVLPCMCNIFLAGIFLALIKQVLIQGILNSWPEKCAIIIWTKQYSNYIRVSRLDIAYNKVNASLENYLYTK